ncbi:MAG: hypothetical protein P4L90_16045 [Rhodopila sp.]|nr:hypothetical protein [Rhodopila sp.]
MKQAVEFGLTGKMSIVLTTPKSRDIAAKGLSVAAGQLLVTSFHEDALPEAPGIGPTGSWCARTRFRPRFTPASVRRFGICCKR